MNTFEKITVGGVIQEGFGLGLKNAPSLLVAVILWMLTFWIPYLNVGTTIALATIPIELSKGKIISPTFIFDSKYRKYMGEFFSLLGLMYLSIFPALFFMIVPGIVIAIGWSLALFIMIDKGISPSEAMILSNKATYGYKWTIFLVSFVLYIGMIIACCIFAFIPFLGILLSLAAMLCYIVVSLGCSSVIYKNLTSDIPGENDAPVPSLNEAVM